MTELFSTKCNSALRVARARPRGTGDTSGTLRSPRGGRERPPGGPTALASVGRLWLLIHGRCTKALQNLHFGPKTRLGAARAFPVRFSAAGALNG